MYAAGMAMQSGGTGMALFDEEPRVRPKPHEIGQVWNFKGYLNNAWHRVQIRVS